MKNKGAAVLLAAGLSIGLGASAAGAATAAVASTVTDRSAAQHINLVGTDLPGWTESPNPPDSSFNAANNAFELCIGAPNPSKVDTANAMSALFSKGAVQMTSNVTMYKTHVDAVADDNSVNSPKLQACTVRYIGKAIQQAFPKGYKVKNVRATPFAAPAGLPNGQGVRLTAAVVASHGKKKSTVTLTEDDIVLVVGRAEITLTETVTGATPVPDESALLRTLQQRAFLVTL